MVLLTVVFPMKVEDLLDTLRHELIAQRRRFPSSPLAVVGASHRVRPAVAISDAQPHLMLAEYLLEGLAVDAARIEQRLGDLVPEHLLEPAVLETATPQIPVGLGLLRVGQHLTALVPHELVIDLPQTP